MNYLSRDKYGIYKRETHFKSGPDTRHGPGPSLMGADTLIGNSVYNSKAENLGEIKEIMLDMHRGTVVYAVLSYGGIFGLGEKLFAVPWGALKLDTENKRFVLNVEKKQLESAPGFDADKWPDMADPVWAQTIHTYYSATPPTELNS